MAIAITAQLTFGSIAQAQDTTEMETGTVVVSATRTEQLIEDVPASMQVFTSEDIKKMGARTVMDVMKRGANITLATGKGSAVPSIRGLGGDYTLILVNGRKPVGGNSNSFLDTQYQNSDIIERINMDNIERIEIIRGSASAIYGSDAVGGVINIITKQSTERSGSVGLIVTGNEEIDLYSTIDLGQMGSWSALATVSYTDFTGQQYTNRKYDPTHIPGEWNETKDGYKAMVDLNLGYEINEKHKLSFFGQASWEEYTSLSNSWSSYYKRFSEESHGKEDSSYTGTLAYDGEVGNHMYSISVGGGININNGWGGTSYENGAYRTTVFNAEAKDTWFLNDWNTLTFGGEFKANFLNDNFAESLDLVDGKENQIHYAFYLQDEISLFDEKLYIIPAIRYDKHSDFEGRFSPKIGISYEFLEGHYLKANYGLSFKAPAVNYMYRDNDSYVPNPSLKPEHGSSWEVTYSGEYKNFFGSITYFENDLTDKIYRVDTDIPNPTSSSGRMKQQYINADEFSSNGIELKLGFDFLKYFTFTAYYDYLDTYISTRGYESVLPNAAKHTYSGELSFFHPEWDLSASLWGKYYKDYVWKTDSRTGEYFLTNFYSVDLTLSKTWNDKYTLFAGFYDIFDNRDEESYRRIDDFKWRVGLEVKF